MTVYWHPIQAANLPKTGPNLNPNQTWETT
jgi:hypothetical protein